MTDSVATESVVQGMRIACPDGWADKSMLILNGNEPGPSGVIPNLVVSREAAPDDLPTDRAARLETFVDRQIKQMRRSLPGLTEVARQHATAAQWSAELKINWNSGDVPLSQWVTYANAGGDTFIIATATAGRDDFASFEPVFQTMLQTVRLT